MMRKDKKGFDRLVCCRCGDLEFSFLIQVISNDNADWLHREHADGGICLNCLAELVADKLRFSITDVRPDVQKEERPDGF